MIDRVEEHFGGEALGVVTGEILFVDFVVLVGKLAELIDLRAADRAHQVFQIVTGVDEVSGQGVEQFRVRRWIGFAQVIFRLDDAAVEEMFPVPVDQ